MLTVRPEQPRDIDAIRAVLTAAFPSEGEARLVDALREAGRLTISLVGEDQGEIVGHVAFSPVTVADGSNGLGLAPLAVLPARQRRGVGAELVRAGLADCGRRGTRFVVVLGEPAYYGRFGFRPATTWGLSDEYGGGEAFQALEFLPGAIPRGAGLVKYAPEFSSFA